MIQITRSNSLSILAKRLAATLEKSASDDPFVPQTIIAPNLDTARWLKLFLAENNGFAGNINCILPAEWQWKQVRKLWPELPGLLPSDPAPMKWTLFELLLDDQIRARFPVLDRYIAARPVDVKEEAVLHLAAQISSVFDQYLVYRPGMLLRWQNEKTGSVDEEWQAELWQMLHQTWKKKEAHSLNRAELFQKTFRAIEQGNIKTDEYLFVFNAGLMPMSVIQMIKAAGDRAEIEVYHLQPTTSFEGNENELIRSFGQESRNVQQVIQALEGEVQEDFSADFADSTLGDIKRSVVSGSPVANIRAEGNPEGIEIRSCHSPLREIETLQQFLLEKFEADETLNPDDVLIVTPDLDNYKQAIHVVFDNPEQGQPAIPYHLGGFRNSDTGLIRSAEQLLQLTDSRFRFSQVMDLFQAEPVREKLQLTTSDASRVRKWMEENHVIWGIDSEHRKEWGQPADEWQTWHSALKSGWLGHLFGTEETHILDDTLLYDAITGTGEQEVWAEFTHWLNQLKVMRKEVQAKKTIVEWCSWFESVLAEFFDEKTLDSHEGIRLVNAIQKVSNSSRTAGSVQSVSFSLFRDEIRKELQQSASSGAMFTRGVTFSSMVPVRSIPFRIIALIGLNEHDFPRKPFSPSYDLIAQHPKTGDRNRKLEDRNLFLESILAAQDVHYCSYTGQSPVDNEPIPPSSIVSEWLGILETITGLEEEQLIRKEALNGFSPSNFAERKSFSRTYYKAVQALFSDEEPVAGIRHEILPPSEEAEKITIRDLTGFFRNPLDWFLRKRFEVWFKDDGEEKDEFGISHLEAHILFQRVFGWTLSGMEEDKIFRTLLLSGAVPSGWPGLKKARELKRSVQEAIAVNVEHGLEPQIHREQLSFTLKDHQIEDEIITYSNLVFLDINPSKFSGKLAVQSWIRYLCRNASREEQDEGFLLCDLKKGSPKLFSLKPPEQPLEVLQEMVDVYEKGLHEPQLFFPKSLYEYEETGKKKGEAAALKKAASEFEGGFRQFGEREHIAISTLLGKDARFSDRFLNEIYLRVIRTMQSHIKEVS
ncbi:MAG: exodeoxyribonuclease V subunit gamma [Balneolaceae bacterium]|nr:exodeoxyribonuclease V subunit gamma [Balneolaceae bacterium]